MKTTDLLKALAEGKADEMLTALYGSEALDEQKARYSAAITEFEKLFGADRDAALYSVAGRTEISGNHTDHNYGRVVAGSLNLDVIAVAAKRDDSMINVNSQGFGTFSVDFEKYNKPDPDKFTTSDSIIAGMCQGFLKNGHNIGGFDAFTTSNVLKGSGMSSSAAFEDMIGNILNHMYNDGKVDNIEIAMLSQYAENEFFGKPCGLMDQVACAAGGLVGIDFKDPSAPVIEKMEFDLDGAGYSLCIVNTGGNHADLGEDYASVPSEMKSVAAAMGKTVLRETDEAEVIAAIPALRQSVGDRAIMRALHFFEENKRVDSLKEAVKAGDMDGFFRNIMESGRSSFCYLQNVYTVKNVNEQGISLALCLADKYLKDKKAAWRVHGGGFGGTIQAFVPTDCAAGFRDYMDAALGEGSCLILRIRPYGAVKVI
ncbi:MAG: galactokinase family protein [Clostridia bacterium]|nr:galactokinase family protein [Clostridia bacterium]